MSKNAITAEKLAKVAEMVRAQKAKSDLAKGTKKSLETPVKAAKMTKDQTEEKAARLAAREEKAKVRALDRAEKRGGLEEKRAAKKAERAAVKAAKLADKAGKEPSWMRKIERLREALPASSDDLKALSRELLSFSDVDLTSALAYVEFERRRRGIQATAAAKSTDAPVLNVGDTVRIKNCNARKFIGLVGVVTLVRRIRAFVAVDGFDTTAYVFTTDVEVLTSAVDEDANHGVNILDTSEDAEEESESTGTEG
jgi:hypothetical protein